MQDSFRSYIRSDVKQDQAKHFRNTNTRISRHSSFEWLLRSLDVSQWKTAGTSVSENSKYACMGNHLPYFQINM
jgi:hypothetical protein